MQVESVIARKTFVYRNLTIYRYADCSKGLLGKTETTLKVTRTKARAHLCKTDLDTNINFLIPITKAPCDPFTHFIVV